MKLSEAMLLGSIGTGQCRGKYLDENGNTCAIGAACKADGIEIEIGLTVLKGKSALHLAILNQWPILKAVAIDPEKHTPCYVGEMITILNDFRGWTRPQIAAWVATIEPAEAVVTEQPKEVPHDLEMV